MIIFLLLFFTPLITYTFQKAPETPLKSNRSIYISSTVDSDNQVVYLESIPIIADNDKGDTMALIPMVKKHQISTESSLQFLLVYYPNMARFETHTIESNQQGTLSDTTILTTNSHIDLDESMFEDLHIATLASSRHKVSMPILTIRHAVEKSNKKYPSQIKTSGSLYLFPGNVTNMLLALKDVNKNDKDTIDIPHIKTIKKSNMTIITTSSYTLDSLHKIYKKSKSGPSGNLVRNIQPILGNDVSDLNNKFTVNNQIIITIKNDNTTHSFPLSPYYRSVLEFLLKNYDK